ncbi:unnamed protein product [Caenorhabditis nigoni]
MRRIRRLERDSRHKLNNLEFHRRRRAQLQQAVSDCLTCSICFDKFNIDESSPRALQCGHVVCLNCVRRLLEMKRRQHRLIYGGPLTGLPLVFLQCPTCNKDEIIFENQTEHSVQFHHPMLNVVIKFAGRPYLDDIEHPDWNRANVSDGNERAEELQLVIIALEQKINAMDEAEQREIQLHNDIDENAKPIKECARCQNQYHQAPRVLKCNHLLCSPCVNNSFASFNANEVAYALCPTCRQKNYYYQTDMRGTPFFQFIDASQLQ